MVGTISNANYQGSASGTLAIAKANQTITFGALAAKTYGAAAFTMTATATSTLAVGFTSSAPAVATVSGNTVTIVGAGSTTLTASQAGNGNYSAASDVPQTLTVNKAAATVTLGNLTTSYDGTAKSVSVTTTPAGLTVNVTYAGGTLPPVAVGSYAVVATVNSPNYTGSASGTLVINKGTATVVISNTLQAYTGTPRPVTVTTTPANLTVDITYAGSTTAPTSTGTYAVVASVKDPSYLGSASGTLVITATALVRHGMTVAGDVLGSLQILTAENVTFNSGGMVSSDLLIPGTPTVKASSSSSTFAGIKYGTGSATPTKHTVTLNGGSTLRYLICRTDAIPMPTVAAPPKAAGTRDVTIRASTQSLGDPKTLRNLTVTGTGTTVTLPPGTYGTLTVDSSSVLVLGVAGATTPSVYNVAGFLTKTKSAVQVVGPIIINSAAGPNISGNFGNATHPEWLVFNVAAGGLTLGGGGITFAGDVIAPSTTGAICVGDQCKLLGRVVCDTLTVSGQGLVQQALP